LVVDDFLSKGSLWKPAFCRSQGLYFKSLVHDNLPRYPRYDSPAGDDSSAEEGTSTQGKRKSSDIVRPPAKTRRLLDGGKTTSLSNIPVEIKTKLPSGMFLEDFLAEWIEELKTGPEQKYILELKNRQKQSSDEGYSVLDEHSLRAVRFLEEIKASAREKKVGEMFKTLSTCPIAQPDEDYERGRIPIAVRHLALQILRDILDKTGCAATAVSEASVMKQTWDTIFDDIAAGVVSTSPPEEAILSSKARRGTARRADKCWRYQNLIEGGWLEAAKKTFHADLKKDLSDFLKVLKGSKDMLDFARAFPFVEVYGMVASQNQISCLSFVKLLSGVVLCKNVYTVHVPPASKETFPSWVNALLFAVYLTAAMMEQGRMMMDTPKFLSDEEDGPDSTVGTLPSVRTP
ncbi:hypothetical protein HK104_009541, partial [Borealophlyctis nickersoniae]